MRYTFGMAKIDDIYEAVDDFGLITSAEAAELGMSRAEMVQQEKLGKLVRVARGVYRMPIWPSQPGKQVALRPSGMPRSARTVGPAQMAATNRSCSQPQRRASRAA